MKDKLEKDSRKTTETFYLTNPETQSFLYSEKIKEKDEGKRGCLEWFIPRESRKRKGMSRMRGPWSTCRTVYI